MHYNKVILGFAPELVPLVKDGVKTLTYRLGLKYGYLEVGDTFLVEDSSRRIPFAELELINKEEMNFESLPIDRVGHEVYGSKEEQRKTFEGFYNRPVLDEDPVLILEYRVLRIVVFRRSRDHQKICQRS